MFSLPHRPRVLYLIATIALTASVLWLYGASLGVGFVGDDYYFLDASDSLTKVGKSLTGDWFWHDQDIEDPRYYRPLQIALTYLESRWLWGEKSWGFHFDLLLIHIATSLLIVPLVLLLGGSSNPRSLFISAWIAAFVFAWHPRHTEPVCMLNGRTDSLCGLFVIASLVTYSWWREGGWEKAKWLSWMAFILALLSKEIAIVLPFVIAVYKLTNGFRSRRIAQSQSFKSSLYAMAPHFVILIFIFGLLRTWALGGYVFGKTSYLTIENSLQLYLIAIDKIVLVLVIPFDSLIRSIVSHVFTNPATFERCGWIVIMTAAVTFVVAVVRGNRLWSVGLGLCVMGSLPVLSQLSDLQTTLGDRYLYIPSIGIALIAADFIHRVMNARNVIRYTTCALLAFWLIACIPQTRQYVRQWRIAGDTASSIFSQLKQLDEKYAPNKKFCLLSMPGLYQGKPVLNTGLARYWNHRLNSAGRSDRLAVPFLFLNLQTVPQDVRTQTAWQGDRFVHSTEGGNFLYFYQPRYAGIQLEEDSFSFGTHRVEFTPGEVDDSVVFLVWDRGKLTPVPIQLNQFVNEIVVANGPGGDAWIERRTMGSSPRLIGTHRALTSGMIEKSGHDPKRGVHLSCGDIDGDGREDLAVSLGPTGDPTIDYPGIVMLWDERDGQPPQIIGHPFSAFPKRHSGSIANPYGEVFTAIGRFIPGMDRTQIACSQGYGGNQVVRLFQYTAREAPNGYRIVSQFKAFEGIQLDPNRDGSMTLSSGDIDRNGVDELLAGPIQNGSSDLVFQMVKFVEPDSNEELATAHHRTFVLPRFDPPVRNPEGTIDHAIADVDGDGWLEIVIASKGGKPQGDQPLHSRIGIIRIDPEGESLSEWTFVPSESFDVMIPTRNPTGSLSIAGGNLDRDPADEIVVGSGEAGFSPLDNALERIERRQPFVKALDFIFNNEGELQTIDPLFSGDEGVYLPWNSSPERASHSIDVVIRKR